MNFTQGGSLCYIINKSTINEYHCTTNKIMIKCNESQFDCIFLFDFFAHSVADLSK